MTPPFPSPFPPLPNSSSHVTRKAGRASSVSRGASVVELAG
jgi:hypothetical protein